MNDLVQLMDLLEAGHVQRLHTCPTIHGRSVAHHSYNIMLMLDWVYEGNPPMRIMRAAMYHDLHEKYLGDIPSPIKENPAIREGLRAVEDEINQQMGINYELDENENTILKALDGLEFMFYLLQERRLGSLNNSDTFARAYNLYPVPNEPKRLLAIHKYIVNTWYDIHENPSY